jgi:hypothetical protein
VGFSTTIKEAAASAGANARAQRWEMFRDAFPDIGTMRVLDLGGTVASWQSAAVRPREVTVVNLCHQEDPGEEWIVRIQGDACRAADVLSAAGVHPRFDVVFSNSLIEHVGGHARRAELAEQVHELAPRHWVQTPYRYFPIEPHWLFPGIQFLPVAARGRILMHWPLTYHSADIDTARARAMSTELLGMAEMRTYFPGSVILRERVFGMTKALIALCS